MSKNKIRVIIASDWEKKCCDAKKRSTWESVRSQLLAKAVMLLGARANVDLLFPVKIFLNDDENKIHIFACRFPHPFLVSSRLAGSKRAGCE